MPVQMVRLVDERCNEDNQNISRWMGVSRVPRMGLDQGSGLIPFLFVVVLYHYMC